MRADPEKMKAVVEWPVPETRQDLQRFLGFANFYRRFLNPNPDAVRSQVLHWGQLSQLG